MPAATPDDLRAANLFYTWISTHRVPVLESRLLLYRLGVPQQIPAGSGDVVQVQYPSNLTASTIPTHPLATGAANQLTYNTATMQVRFHANDIQFDRMSDVINSVDYRGGSFGRLLYNGAQVADLVARDALEGMTTNVQRVNDQANDNAMTTADFLTLDELNEATTTLDDADVETHSITPGAYCGVFHTRMLGELRGHSTFVAGTAGHDANAITWYDFVRRQDASALVNASEGRFYRIEMKGSTNIRRTQNTQGTATFVYNNLIVGDHLFMTGSVAGLPTVRPGEQGGGLAINLIPPMATAYTPYANVWVLAYAYYASAGLIDDTRGVLLKGSSGS